MIVLDASAILAAMLGEPGAERVDPYLKGAFVSTINLAEILSRMASHGEHPRDVCADLRHVGLNFIEVDANLDCRAAELFLSTRPAGMSVGDRCCVALAERLGCPAMTPTGAGTGRTCRSRSSISASSRGAS